MIVVQNCLAIFFKKVVSYIQFVPLLLSYTFLYCTPFTCFAKRIPSILKKISLGLVFGLVTLSIYIIMLTVGGVTFHFAPFTIPIDYRWLLIPHSTCALTLFLVIVSSLEFTLAQSPKSMRGMMIGLWYASLGIGKFVDRTLSVPFEKYVEHNVLCKGLIAALYAIIVSLIIAVIVIVIFIPFAKWYKFRIRENIVPVNQIAEEHYERYQEQSDEYRRQYGIHTSSESSNLLSM